MPEFHAYESTIHGSDHHMQSIADGDIIITF